LRAFVALIVVALAYPPAMTGTGLRNGLVLFLIIDVRVQQELKLTEAQCEAAYGVWTRTNDVQGDLVRKLMRTGEIADIKKDEETLARINAEHSASVAKLLDREQFARYEQIRLQYLREEALLEPAVQKAIKLDAVRAEKLASIFFGHIEAVYERLLESQKLPEKEQFRLVSQRMLANMTGRDAALKQMRELLTDEQRAAFEALKGPVFRFEGREKVGDPRKRYNPRRPFPGRS
jgi:hypothetical protein